MAIKGHFYFSQKQKEQKDYWQKMIGKSPSICLCELEDDGQIIEYTEASTKPLKHLWDDGVYLGYGIIHSVNGIKQFDEAST